MYGTDWRNAYLGAMMKDYSFVKALKVSVPTGILMGIMFGFVVDIIDPAMSKSATAFSILGCIILLTPFLYLNLEKRKRLDDSFFKHVSETHSVLHQEDVNLFVNNKLKASGSLFLTEKSLMFFSTEKNREKYNFEYPFDFITRISKVSDRASTSNAMTITTSGSEEKISFTVLDRDYWINQLQARIN